ncbi:hypothetical protein S245_030318, partial [Arachis hypogaea]
MSKSLFPSLRPSHFHFTFIVQHFSSTILIKVQRDIGNAITLRRAVSSVAHSRASHRILRVVCSHLASLLCAWLLAPPSASECSSCASWLLLVVRGCLCLILPPSVTRVSSQSLASHGSPVSSPAAEATRGVVPCVVAFLLVVVDSPSIV